MFNLFPNPSKWLKICLHNSCQATKMKKNRLALSLNLAYRKLDDILQINWQWLQKAVADFSYSCFSQGHCRAFQANQRTNMCIVSIGFPLVPIYLSLNSTSQHLAVIRQPHRTVLNLFETCFKPLVTWISSDVDQKFAHKMRCIIQAK